ncbi:fasciclin domain-containing protein [Mucilaginibacter sp. NFX135]|uniref:fasciclin domain-containing protein n=1 Tax=Mucilaginibacter sp. NFX135 TaxID=3402687 RepID=UPI003AFA0A8A
MKKILLLSLALMMCSFAVLAQAADTDPVNNIPALGPMHTIAGDSMQPANDIVQNIASDKDLSIFYNFVSSANLTETYKSKGPITIFVPANDAFESLSPGKLDTLSKPSHVWELTHILAYHAVAGKFSAKELHKLINKHKGATTLTTLSGGKLIAKIDGNNNIVLEDETGGQSIITRFDIAQSNGVVHIINKVLLPKPKAV